MTKAQKQILFLGAVGIFLILSFFIVAYALGYRYDFLENKLVKTGSLYIKVQTDAAVFINDKNFGNTSLIGNSFSKSNLLPREYKIRLEKDGYYPWQKTVHIQGGFFSDFSSVLLVKKELLTEKDVNGGMSSKSFQKEPILGTEDIKKIANSLSLPSSKIKKAVKEGGYFYVIGVFDKKKLFYRIKNDFKEPEFVASDVEDFIFDYSNSKLAWFGKNELWTMWLRDTSYQPTKKAGDKELITRTSKNIKNVQWHYTEEHLIFLLDDEINFTELDGRNERNLFKIYQAPNLKNIYYDKDRKKLYITSEDKNNLWLDF